VFVESNGTWSQQAELTASDGANNNYFGFSVAVSGSTVAVGAPGYPAVGSNVAQGAAYVFAESGGTWSQQAELTASDGAAYDQLGSSVAVTVARSWLGHLATISVKEWRTCSSKAEERGVNRRS